MQQPLVTFDELVDALAGEALEPHPSTEPCYPCRGTGKLLVGEGRGQLYDCPNCRGKGVLKLRG